MTSMKTRRTIISLFAALTIMTTGAATTGCAAVAQWWQSVTSSPGSAISFLQYVLSFLQGLISVWNTIAPLIPATAQAQAQTAFNNAVYTVEQADAALQDAIRAAAAAQQSSPDFSTFITNIQAAVAALMSIVQQWSTGGAPSADAGALVTPKVAGLADITRQAGVIASWK
jgi:hypothetical protein